MKILCSRPSITCNRILPQYEGYFIARRYSSVRRRLTGKKDPSVRDQTKKGRIKEEIMNVYTVYEEDQGEGIIVVASYMDEQSAYTEAMKSNHYHVLVSQLLHNR